jgi:hypothetical protein
MLKFIQVFLGFALIACNSNIPIDNTASDSSNTVTISRPGATKDLNGCYQLTIKKDTATMNLVVKDSAITGNLVYNWFEKDGNVGTLEGILRDGLIYADYTFESEGMTSVREMIFKLDDTLLLQAVGDLDERDKKIVYKDTTKLDFTVMPPFVKIACPAKD